MGFSLAGKVAIVTGGASGIGRATVQRFVAERASVMIADTQAAAADALVAELSSGGATVGAVGCDISSEAAVEGLVRETVARFGRLDILANVAGIFAERKPIDEASLEDFNRVIGVNLTGTFLCMKHAVKVMRPQRYGRIVNVSSMAAVRPANPGMDHYTASKGGVTALTRQLVLDLIGTGITVNAVAPGIIRTPLTELHRGEAWLQNMIRLTPAGRLGTPEDVAAAIAFLASDDAEFINGQLLLVDGGMTDVLIS